MSQISAMLLKQASELKQEVAAQEEWSAIKQAAVEALVSQGFNQNTVEEVMKKLETSVNG